MILSKENIADKTIIILGMKKSGYSAALLASKFGASIFISDKNKDEILCQNYEKLKKAGIPVSYTHLTLPTTPYV